MFERIGKERLLEMLLAGTPDRMIDALVAASPDDQVELAALREGLVLEAMAATPTVKPRASVRDRLLATRPRPRRPVRPALVVLDMIQDHLTPGRPLEVPRARDIVPALRQRLDEARAASIPVIFVCDTHAADDPDYHDWPLHALEGTPGADPWPALGLAPSDRIVRKRTYSAFAGSNLGDLLDELRTDRIILTGCATEIGVAVTAADALQRGFVVDVPPDSQAGTSFLLEQITMLTLSAMPPYDPRYLRGAA
jgi:nicotinamidase-related amidase